MSDGRGVGPTEFGGRTLLVASTGGHLEELIRLRGRLQGFGPFEWATFEGPQARALLADEVVHVVGDIGPRDLAGVAAAVPPAVGLLRSRRFERVVSTGSAVAVPFFLAARALGLPAFYIESAARPEGPSFTGRLLGLVPGVLRYTQYQSRASRGWGFCGSVFDGFAPGRLTASPAPRDIHRVVVTFGTMRRYGFRRAAERLASLLPQIASSDAEILWQTGCTDLTGLGVHGHDLVPATDLSAAVREADLVIAHGGVGSALNALDAGRAPVLLARRAGLGEHVDDHQVQICEHLDGRGVAVGREVSELSTDDLLRAASISVQARSDAAPLDLGET